MATISKQILSGSTNGTGITVANTATVGTTIHATGTSASILDEIWLYAVNIHSSAVTLTVEYGGVSTTKDLIQQSIAATPSGLVLVCAGLILRGTGSAATTVTAFANSASKIEIFGFVNRIAQVLLVSRYSFRTQVQQPTLANWGKAAPAGIGAVEGYGVATGGTSSSITVSSVNYTLLTFTSDGNLVVVIGGLFDVLAFGGGGGGGGTVGSSYGGVSYSNGGGGGGAGGRVQTTLYLAAGTYTVTVGAGGAAETKGAESSIGSVLQAVGGGAAQYYGAVGASGGGSNGLNGTAPDASMRVLGQGNISGNASGNGGFSANQNRGGGGGGVGAAGSGGNGGTGVEVNTFISGSSLFKGGGGAGYAVNGGYGSAGTGGGGAGGVGTANSGGGGGGSAYAGGSGIVYVRFKI